MNKIRKKLALGMMVIALMLILTLMLSACAPAVTAQGALAYTENALLPQGPFETADADAINRLLQDLYINEGDICAFRGSGLVDGLLTHICDTMLPAVLLAEKTGIQDEALRNLVERFARHVRREIDRLDLLNASAALCLERLVLGVDNQERINRWIAAHTHEPSGLLVESGAIFDEAGPDEERIYYMMVDTELCLRNFRKSGIDINTDSFRKSVEAYCQKYEFKLPGEETSMLKAGGNAIDLMANFGIDVSRHLSWWEAWRATFPDRPIDENTDFEEYLTWIYYAECFSDNSIQNKLDEYLRDTDFTELLNPESFSVQILYVLLEHVLPELSAEKREAVLARCRYTLDRMEEHLLAPTLRDSFFGASLARASGFSVDWDKLLSCCCAMLEKEMSAADRDLTKLSQNLYYLAMLYEQIKDSVGESSRESAVNLLRGAAESCMKDYREYNILWDRQLCEVLTALGISKDGKFVKAVRSQYDEFLNYRDVNGTIKDISGYFELYMVDRSCNFGKISDGDLQEVLTNLSLEGLYMMNAHLEPKMADLKSTYWAICVKTRNEALGMTQEERLHISEQAAAQFESAADSPDLADIYYYYCLKYLGNQALGGTP